MQLSKHTKSSPAHAGFMLTLLASTLAQAQTSTEATALQRVEITGTADSSYAPVEASSATRTATPLKETPVTVQVVDRTLIKDKRITTPRELADTVAGVQQVVGYGNTASQWFVIRGFSSDSVNYRDGYRSADKYTPRDFANVERVEFVKGPSSVLYGQAQPAGAVNTVTKTPLPFDAGFADVSLGSYSTVRSTIDLNRVFGGVSVRLNAAADRGDSFVDHEQSRNVLLAPSIRWQATRDLELLYSGEYQRTTVDGFSNGLPMANGVFDLPASATVSQPWAELKNRNTTHRVEARFAINEAWSFRQGFYDSTTRRRYAGISPAFNQFDGTALADYPIMYNAGPKDDQRNTVWQSEVTGTVKQGAVTHRLLAGFEAFKSKFDYAFYDQFGCDDLGNCFGGYTKTFSTGLPYPSGGFTGGFADSSAAKTRALYLNDQISWEAWRLMVGVRHDRVETSAGSTSQDSSATTGRLGLLYLFTPQTSAYVSVGQSFVPNLGQRLGGGVLDPEKGLQQEVGIKHSWYEGLESTLAVFRIKKSDIRYQAPSDPTAYLTFGEQESRGIEASLAGQVTPGLKLIANYAWLDYAKTTKDKDPANVGVPLYGVAKTNFNLWGVQDLPDWLRGKLSVGAGVVHVGERTADSVGSSFRLPAYTRADLALFYKVDKLDLALNIKNVNDADIFDTAEGYFVQRQAPRNVTLTVGVKF